MTRNRNVRKVVEGFFKDVLTYDVSRHHPQPGRRASHMRPASSKRRGATTMMGRHDPKKFYPSAHRASQPVPVPKGYHHEIKTSSARRPGPTVRQRRGRKAILGTAAAIGAGMAAHRIYQAHQARKKEMREVFDDTYGHGVFARSANVNKQSMLKHKARQLRAQKKKMYRSWGKEAASVFKIAEATVDYVMTRVRNGRSVGPAWVMKQDRELQNASRYMQMPDPNVIEKRLGLREGERVTLKVLQRVRNQRYAAQAGERAQDVKRIASGLNMRKPKMRKYAKQLYKDFGPRS